MTDRHRWRPPGFNAGFWGAAPWIALAAFVVALTVVVLLVFTGQQT